MIAHSFLIDLWFFCMLLLLFRKTISGFWESLIILKTIFDLNLKYINYYFLPQCSLKNKSTFIFIAINFYMFMYQYTPSGRKQGTKVYLFDKVLCQWQHLDLYEILLNNNNLKKTHRIKYQYNWIKHASWINYFDNKSMGGLFY